MSTKKEKVIFFFLLKTLCSSPIWFVSVILFQVITLQKPLYRLDTQNHIKKIGLTEPNSGGTASAKSTLFFVSVYILKCFV